MNKDTLIILGTLVLGFVFISYQIQKLGDRIEGQNRPLVDNKGQVIYPYLQREVKNTITRNAADMQKCFNDHIAGDPETTAGKIHVEWQVLESGGADNARLISSGFPDEKFNACVLKAVETWDFPPPDRKTYVEHIFNFADQKTLKERRQNREEYLQNLPGL